MTHIADAQGKRARLHRKQNGLCYYCGNGLKLSDATLDHKFPKTLGGIASEWNLAVACGPCNQAKGSMTAEEFIAATNAIGKAG